MGEIWRKIKKKKHSPPSQFDASTTFSLYFSLFLLFLFFCSGRHFRSLVIYRSRNNTLFSLYYVLSSSGATGGRRTMVQNNEESGLKYWATHSSVRSFARLLAPLTHLPAPPCLLRLHALLRSLVYSLGSFPRSWESGWLDGYLFCVLIYSGT